jgi:hypothetical protein
MINRPLRVMERHHARGNGGIANFSIEKAAPPRTTALPPVRSALFRWGLNQDQPALCPLQQGLEPVLVYPHARLGQKSGSHSARMIAHQ